jgi:hypothetical protein
MKPFATYLESDGTTSIRRVVQHAFDGNALARIHAVRSEWHVHVDPSSSHAGIAGAFAKHAEAIGWALATCARIHEST